MKSFHHIDRNAIERIAKRSVGQLQKLAASKRMLYREREIRQGRKTRSLLVPRQPLKTIQKRLNQGLLARLEPHPAAYCGRGRGILEAAKKHAHDRWFFRADIKNFYPSVGPSRVEGGLRRLGLKAEMASLLTRLVTIQDQLPQGAPTSSAAGEIALFPLDCRLWGLTQQAQLTYTRYADDITISGGRHLKDRLAKKVREIVNECGWTLNKKGGIFGPDDRHEMLGLIVNAEPNVGRHYTDKLRFVIGLARKDKVGLSSDDLDSLAGKITWVKQVNPSRGQRLEELLRPLLVPG